MWPLTFILSILLVIRGLTRGWIRSLISPFSIIVTTFISMIYFQITKNALTSLAIGLFGPIALNLGLNFLLKTWGAITDTKPSLPSRLGAAALTLLWGWIFIICALMLLAIFPFPKEKKWSNLRQDVVQSISYTRIVKPLIDHFLARSDPLLQKNVAVLTASKSKKNAQADIKSLAEDPRFQKILQDPEIQKDVEDHNIAKLMSNPKMMALTQEIMNDPEALKKVIGVYNSQK